MLCGGPWGDLQLHADAVCAAANMSMGTSTATIRRGTVLVDEYNMLLCSTLV